MAIKSILKNFQAARFPVVEISALKGTGVMEAAEAAIEAAGGPATIPQHEFFRCC